MFPNYDNEQVSEIHEQMDKEMDEFFSEESPETVDDIPAGDENFPAAEEGSSGESSSTPETETKIEAAATTATTESSAPSSLTPEELEVWKTLPESAKAIIARREQDFHKGIEAYKGAAQLGHSFQTLIAPYQDIYKQYGIDPVQSINGLLQSHYILATGTPEQKMELLNRIVRDYNIAPAEQDNLADPEITALKRQVEQLTSAQNQYFQASKLEAATRQLEAFSANPAHVYFNEVAGDMATLMRGDPSLTLEQAYDRAVWSNATTRAKMIVQQKAATTQSTSQEKQTQTVQRARQKVLTNVKGSAKPGGNPPADKSMEQYMSDYFDSIS